MTTYVFEGYELDTRRHELRHEGALVAVEPQVFSVLAYLAAHADRVVGKEELLDAVWQTRFVTESALTSRIKAARRAIGDDGRAQQAIRTIHGRGLPVRCHGECPRTRSSWLRMSIRCWMPSWGTAGPPTVSALRTAVRELAHRW